MEKKKKKNEQSQEQQQLWLTIHKTTYNVIERTNRNEIPTKKKEQNNKKKIKMGKEVKEKRMLTRLINDNRPMILNNKIIKKQFTICVHYKCISEKSDRHTVDAGVI